MVRTVKGHAGFQHSIALLLIAIGVVVATFVATPAHGEDPGRGDAYPALAGLRYGISVTDLDGNVLVAHRADERFMPASNGKLFVTAAALSAHT